MVALRMVISDSEIGTALMGNHYKYWCPLKTNMATIVSLFGDNRRQVQVEVVLDFSYTRIGT